VRALDFWRATEVLGPGTPEQLLTAYAVAGGLPRYLAVVPGAEDPGGRLAAACLDPHGPLFDEPRAILAQELEVPHTYFSILSALASGPRPWGDLVLRSGVESSRLARYLQTLEDLGLVTRRVPVTDAGGVSRDRLYAIEDIARGWVRRTGHAAATRVGSWWGPALDEFRVSGARTREEIDIVGMARGRVTVIGEVRWRSKPLDVGILGDIRLVGLEELVAG